MYSSNHCSTGFLISGLGGRLSQGVTPGNSVLVWKLYLSLLVETNDLPSQFLHLWLIAKTTTHLCSAKVTFLQKKNTNVPFFFSS